MRPALLVGLVLLLASSSRAEAQRTPRRVAPSSVLRDRARLRDGFSGVRARNTVAFIEQYFRVPGNAGFNASLDLVVSELAKAGYVPEATAPAGAALVYRVEQRPMSRNTWEPIAASVTIVGDRAPLLRFTTNRNMLAINSGSTPDTGVVADVVFVGEGSDAEYARAPVAGKIVLAHGSLSRTYSEGVVKRGALGVLAYGMPAYTQPETHPTSIQFGQIARDTAGHTWAIALSYAAWDTLRRRAAAGPLRARVMTKAASYRSVERTVVAEIRGLERPDERFVLSAHVQEPGANDNASGVGALTELARTLADLTTRRQWVARRTITMIFGNEIEQTRNYLADSARARTVRWGMSLDMVGEDVRKTGGTFLIEKMPDPSAIWTRGDDRHTEWGGSPVPVSAVHPHYYNDFVRDRCLDQAEGRGWNVRTNPYEGGSDHVPFLTAHKPAVLLWHFTDVFYHTDGDRLDKVSAEELENSGICAGLAAMTLTTADGVTARALVAEQEYDAGVRLDAELALSRAAIAAGGDVARETTILAAWAAWFDGALASMDDIEVAGSSDATRRAIAEARERVARRAAEAIALFDRRAP